MVNNRRSLRVSYEIHGRIKRMAVLNDVKMYLFATRLLTRMFTDHKDEVKQILKELKMSAS